MGEMRSLARFRFLLAPHLWGVLLTEDFFGEKPLPRLFFLRRRFVSTALLRCPLEIIRAPR